MMSLKRWIVSGIVLALIVLAANGNILLFTTPPVQICIGWPDVEVYSYWCTPDYTARAPAPDKDK